MTNTNTITITPIMPKSLLLNVGWFLIDIYRLERIATPEGHKWNGVQKYEKRMAKLGSKALIALR